MTGDNEHEPEGAGDEPTPESAEASAGGSLAPESADAAYEAPRSAEGDAVDEPLGADAGDFEEPLSDATVDPLPAPRRFRSWSAVEESKPSIFARLRNSIGAIFKRKPKEEPVVEESADVAEWSAESDLAASRYEGEESPDDRPWMSPRVVEDDRATETETEATQGAIPWIEPAQDTEPASEPQWVAPEPEPAAEVEPTSASAFAPDEEQPEEEEPAAERAGTWEEQQAEVEPVVESASTWEEPQAQEPIAESASAWEEPPAEVDAGATPPRKSHFGGTFFEAPTEIISEEKPAKLGFFARLFGRKSEPKVEPLPVPSPVVEEPVVATNEYATESEEAQAEEKEAQLTEAQLTEAEEIQPQATEAQWPESLDTEPQETEAHSDIEAAFGEVESGYAPVSEPATEPIESSFASVDEALPAAEEPPPAETFAAIEPEAEEAKPGFFSRLFGRKSRKIDKKERPSLEIEIHEDRIAAAADALDQMGGQTYEPPKDATEPVSPFASVDEAFPEPTGDERFAPSDSRPTIETERDSRPTIEVAQDSRPTIEVAQDSRSTVELRGDAVPGSRDTVEVPPPTAMDFGKTMDAGIDLGKTMDAGVDLGKTMDAVPDDDTLEVGKATTPPPASIHLMFGDTIEIADKRRQEADSGAYFGDTLEPSHFGDITPPPVAEEIDKDTDEFAIQIETSAEQPSAAVPDVDEDTAQVSRKSLLQKLLFWRKQQEAAAPTVDGASTVVEGNPNFLFSKFRTFYNEIIRHKHQKSEFTAGFSTAIVTDYTADLSPEGAADALSKNLAAMLELQAAEATWMGGESAQRYPDAQYAMAALADETFLHQEWEGKGAWNKHLLEVKLFKSRSADVELFKRIDKLLKDQPNSAAARDLARVYLMVIAAGFKGKYRPFGLTRALADYRQRLYEYIHHGGDALLLYAPERKIFPEAAERTLVGHAIGRFTSAQRWAAILAFLLLSYTAIAHFAWNRVSADLKDVTDRIKATSTTASGNGSP